MKNNQIEPLPVRRRQVMAVFKCFQPRKTCIRPVIPVRQNSIAMQWTEAVLWLDGPKPHGIVNQMVTIGLIPLALLAQAWGPLFGSAFDRPVRERRVPFYFLLILGLAFVVVIRAVYQPTHTQITPEGHLNWYSPQKPPGFVAWAYGLWAVVI